MISSMVFPLALVDNTYYILQVSEKILKHPVKQFFAVIFELIKDEASA